MFKKLFTGTHHDKIGFIYNPHKTLGYLALIHFFTRYFLFWVYGSMKFYGNFYDLFFILGHLLLSCSSFLFPIRNKRISTNVIIWRELQLHNIIFTLRSCSIMMLMTFFPETSISIRFLTVMANHILADIVSHKIGQGTTTRDMS